MMRKKSRRVIFDSDPRDAPLEQYGIEGTLESDDEAGERNRVGDVPLEWYKSNEHVGYGINQKKIERSLDTTNIITNLIKDFDDSSEAWRVFTDHKNQVTHRISDLDLEIIRRIKKGAFPIASFDPEDSYVEFDNPEERIHPSSNTYRPKNQFLPSYHEYKKICKLAALIRKGRVIVDNNIPRPLFDLWGASIFNSVGDDIRNNKKMPPVIPAPRLPAPSSEEAYNHADPGAKLRRVPYCRQTWVDRFERCLDLYLCPRLIKMRMNIDPESLLPSLPKPNDLKPFPCRLGVEYHGLLRSPATSLCFDSTATYLAIGRVCGALEIMDVKTSRRVLTWKVGEEAVRSVAFNPVYPMIAVACGSTLSLAVVPLPAFSAAYSAPSNWNVESFEWPKGVPPAAGWTRFFVQENSLENSRFFETTTTTTGISSGFRIEHDTNITNIDWHNGGVYLVAICKESQSPSQQLGIHSLKKLSTLRPLRSNPAGKMQQARFHPIKSWLYVGYTKGVRLYNLQKDENNHKIGTLLKKFSGVDLLSVMSVHPSGDHIITGGRNNKVTWFDYDLGEAPFKRLRYHNESVVAIEFHRNYPLMFSAGVDGAVHIVHTKVHDDIFVAPSVIPIKKLACSEALGGQIVSGSWHNTQPWVAVGSTSGRVGLFV